MINAQEYSTYVKELLDKIESQQSANIAHAAEVIFRSLDSGGVLHVFSTGHSHMVAEELFYRAGGLVQVNPLLDDALMLHNGAVKSTRIERLQGYAAAISESAGFKEGEPILIASNSGINAVPVEMALLAKEHGLKVIALTSVGISASLSARHTSGKKLMDIADVVVDNCIESGDAVMEIPGTGQYVGAVSSIAGVYIAQRLAIEVTNSFLKHGKVPPVYMSANIPGGDKHNAALIDKYKDRIRGLY